MTGRDLEGLLVVALEQAVAAPLATARLADAGPHAAPVDGVDGMSAGRSSETGRVARAQVAAIDAGLGTSGRAEAPGAAETVKGAVPASSPPVALAGTPAKP